MKKIVLVACFALFALAGKAQELKGSWVLDITQQAAESKVENTPVMIKTLEGSSTNKLDNELPIKIVFEDSYFYFTYADNTVLEGGYWIEGDALKLGLPDKVAEYKIGERDGKLTIKMAGKEVSLFNKVNE